MTAAWSLAMSPSDPRSDRRGPAIVPARVRAALAPGRFSLISPISEPMLLAPSWPEGWISGCGWPRSPPAALGLRALRRPSARPGDPGRDRRYLTACVVRVLFDHCAVLICGGVRAPLAGRAGRNARRDSGPGRARRVGDAGTRPGAPRRGRGRSAAARTASVLSAARGPGPRAHAAAARRRPGGGAALLRGPPLSPGDVIVHRREYLRFSCWTDCGNRHDARPQNDRYINEYD